MWDNLSSLLAPGITVNRVVSTRSAICCKHTVGLNTPLGAQGQQRGGNVLGVKCRRVFCHTAVASLRCRHVLANSSTIPDTGTIWGIVSMLVLL